MIKLTQNPEIKMLNEIVLVECFKRLSSQNKISLLHSYLCQNTNVLEDTINLNIDVFPKTSKKIIVMMTAISGNDDDKTVDEYTLQFMASIFPPTLKPLVKYNYSKYLAGNIYF